MEYKALALSQVNLKVDTPVAFMKVFSCLLVSSPTEKMILVRETNIKQIAGVYPAIGGIALLLVNLKVDTPEKIWGFDLSNPK